MVYSTTDSLLPKSSSASHLETRRKKVKHFRWLTEEHLWGEGNFLGIIPALCVSHGRQVNRWIALCKSRLELLYLWHRRRPWRFPVPFCQRLIIGGRDISSAFHLACIVISLLNGLPVIIADILIDAILADTEVWDVIVLFCKQPPHFLHVYINSPITIQS